MKKMNNKGYVLIEIVLAFAITFGIIYFMMDIILKMKNKNEDLVYKSVVKTEQSIVTSKLMNYAIDEGEDFKCSSVIVSGQTIKYGDDVIDIVDDAVTVNDTDNNDCDSDYSCSNSNGYSCSNEDGKISIRIPANVKQIEEEEFDIIIDYRYYYDPLNIYTITYDANGGSGAPGMQNKTEGIDLTLSSVIPTREDYFFLGWNTDPTAKSASYVAGSRFTEDVNAVLYAVWQKDPSPIFSYNCKNADGTWKYPEDAEYNLVYDGVCEFVGDEDTDGDGIVDVDGDNDGDIDDDWKFRFLTSGYLKIVSPLDIDLFMVGGGGGGSGNRADGGGGGGGGGERLTRINLLISSDKEHYIEVGLGGNGGGGKGGESKAFNYSVDGGNGGTLWNGVVGTGGSGGGENGAKGGDRSQNGEDGGYEFDEESSGIFYGGGGGGGYNYHCVGVDCGGHTSPGSGGAGGGGGGFSRNGDGTPNTGGGGGGRNGKNNGYSVGGSNGGSGIVIIRNTRLDSKIRFRYDGVFEYIDDGDENWRIKFLSSGNLILYNDVDIDVFLVGGGGGSGGVGDGSANGGGGGAGGYRFTKRNVSVFATTYYIHVGEGGGPSGAGETSTAFDYSANGGGGGLTGRVEGGSSSGVGGIGGANGGRGGYLAFHNGFPGEDGGYEFDEESSETLYGGGGGGGGVHGGSGADGGKGGGGHGSQYASNGVPNTGGGAGGRTSDYNNAISGWGQSGYLGGSGIVVIRNAR